MKLLYFPYKREHLNSSCRKTTVRLIHEYKHVLPHSRPLGYRDQEYFPMTWKDDQATASSGSHTISCVVFSCSWSSLKQRFQTFPLWDPLSKSKVLGDWKYHCRVDGTPKLKKISLAFSNKSCGPTVNGPITAEIASSWPMWPRVQELTSTEDE